MAWIAIGSMLASAALSANAQSNAAERQKQAALEAQRRQLAAQNQATDVAMKQVQEFDPTTRQDKQQTITQDLTQQFEQAAAQPVTAQGVQVGNTIPNGSPEYMAAQAREQAKTTQSLRALASLMGRIGGANELRRGEAVGIGDAAGQIGRIQSGADNVAGIDQIGVDAAGQPSLGQTLASQALGAYGMNKIVASGLKKAPTYPDFGTSTGGNGAWL